MSIYFPRYTEPPTVYYNRNTTQNTNFLIEAHRDFANKPLGQQIFLVLLDILSILLLIVLFLHIINCCLVCRKMCKKNNTAPQLAQPTQTTSNPAIAKYGQAIPVIEFPNTKYTHVPLGVSLDQSDEEDAIRREKEKKADYLNPFSIQEEEDENTIKAPLSYKSLKEARV